MKVLLTCESYLPRVGGAEIHVKNLFERLIDDRHDSSLLTNERGLDLDKVYRVAWSRRNSLKLVRTLWMLSKGRDIIHSHYCHRLAFIAGMIGKIRRIPVVITLHGMGILDHPGAPFWGRMSHSFYRFWSLQLCTYVISTSEDLAQVADKYISRKKITVILNGYDSDLFPFSSRTKTDVTDSYSSRKIILTVRRLVPKNGLHYLVEAMPYILKEIPEAHYLLAGDGNMRSYVEKRIEEMGLSNSITLLGMINNHEVPKYIDEADVVVFPSTAESSSIACAEAMGAGKIVVASRVGGLIELLGEKEERGYLVNLVPWVSSNYDAPLTLPKENYQNLAIAIVKAFSLSEENLQKKVQASKFAQRELSWNAIYEKTLLVYKNSLK